MHPGKRMKYLYSILAIICFIPVYSALSQDNKKALTLNECINIAIQNSPALMVAEEDKKKAMADYRVANASRNIAITADIRTNQYPKQTSSWKYSALDSYVPYLITDPRQGIAYTFARGHQTSQKNFIDELSDHYTLGIAFGITAGVTLYSEKNNRIVEQAKSGIRLSELQARKSLSDVILSVKKSYYSYMLAQESIQIQEKLLKYAQDRLKLTEVFYKNAQKQMFDYNKAKYDCSDAELQLQKAKNTERAARLELLLAMGISDPGNEFVLDRKDEVPVLQYSIEELNKLGDLNYPDLQIVKMQKDISRIKVFVERAGHYPSVDLQLQAAYENGQLDKYVFDSSNWKPSFGAGFVARIPVYSGGMVTARIDSAETEFNKMVYKVKDVKRNMELNLQNSYTLLSELSKQLSMAKLMMENSEKNYRVALRSYESGATTMLELNDSSIARINSEYSYLKTKNDYLMTLAKICSIVGLGEDTLCKK
jgi:outer membrane protein